jgi:hypothetical protein
VPRALLRKASAGVALLRGDLATDAPRASTGETCSMRIELEAGSGRMALWQERGAGPEEKEARRRLPILRRIEVEGRPDP